MKPALTGVPETMLWTLHNRASEAGREKPYLHDPDAVRIYRAIEYDYERSFGPAEPSHAVRSAMFDAELREFVARYPSGVIVNLGEGLETQRYRVDAAAAHWVSVDVPEAMTVRERFIQPDDRHRHVARSVLDFVWMDEIPKDRPTYITGQGLLMYFSEAEVRSLFVTLSTCCPGAWFAFDTIPVWLSQKTTSDNGWRKTKYYRAPAMPWGINKNRIAPTLKLWVPTLTEVTDLRWWTFPRGLGRWVFPVVTSTPLLRRYTPAVTRIRFGEQ